MVNKEQIAAIRDYLLDLDCPFNESAVNAMCDLALKGLESPEVEPPTDSEVVRQLRNDVIEECVRVAYDTPTTLCQNGEFFSERVATAIRALKQPRPQGGSTK
jgi:hypothetical protein